MKLTVVGCAGSFAGPESPASCYLLEAPYEGRIFRLVIDLGNGSLGALQRFIGLDDIDVVALSHLHADHCLDMLSLYVARKYHPDGPRSALPVIGPSETAGYLARAYDLPEDPGMSEDFDFSFWTPSEPTTIGPFEVTPVPMVHPVEAYALRVVHDGKTLVYSGDTGPTEALADLVVGADVFLCEASYVVSRDNPPDLHLTGADAGDYAERGEVGQLLVTHIPSWTDRDEVHADARAAFSGAMRLVNASDVFDI